MKKLTKTLTVMTTSAMVFGLLPFTAFADGSYYVSSSYLQLAPGTSATVYITADNAAGRVDVSSTGPISASGSSFIDVGQNGEITIYADAAGTGYVTVYPTDLATYDGEVLTDGYTIQVDVIGDVAQAADTQDNAEITAEEAPQADVQEEQAEEQAENTAAEETTAEQEKTADSTSGKVLTDGNDDYENLTEEERLYTTVDGQELYMIRYPLWLNEEGAAVWNDEVTGLDQLVGFELKTVNYKGMEVDTFQYEDNITVFVLKNLETNTCEYYTLSSEGKGFTPLTYVTANGRQYIVVDFPESFEVPEGYQLVELSLGNNTVQALRKVSDESSKTTTQETAAETAAETTTEEEVPAAQEEAVNQEAKITVDSRVEVMLTGYETEISPGLDTTDPTEDIYYIYCLVDGKTQLYAYDKGEGTLQRAAIVVYNEIPTEPETIIVYETLAAVEQETSSGSFLDFFSWDSMAIQLKILLIAFAVAILLIIILIIMFAVMSAKNKKYRREMNRRRNAAPAYPRQGRPSGNAPARGRSSAQGRAAERKPAADLADDDLIFSYVKTDDETMDDLK